MIMIYTHLIKVNFRTLTAETTPSKMNHKRIDIHFIVKDE